MWPVSLSRLHHHQGERGERGRGREGGRVQGERGERGRGREGGRVPPHQVEREKYERGVRWLHDLLYGLQFSTDRVVVVATKMVNDVAR